LRETDDSVLATVMLRAQEWRESHESTRSRSSPNSIEDLASALAVEVQTLARRRGLVIDGASGTIVPFSPLKHRIVGAVTGSPKRVRMVVPAVLRKTESSEVLVTQAIVEALKLGEEG